MEAEFFIWAGLGLSFLAAFIFSLFHVSLGSFSKIAISRFLEDKEKQFKLKILEIYEELKISVEILRIFFFTALLIYLYLAISSLRLWPLWLFLISFFGYFFLLELIPRALNSINQKRILGFFLLTFRIPYLLSRPLIGLVKTWTVEKEPEEQREASEEEIDALIEEAEEEGIIEKEEGELLKSVVEFGDTIVREIMTPRVAMICINKNSDIGQLRDLVIKEKHSRIPIYKDRIDNIEGIIIAKDLLEYSADKLVRSSLEPLLRPVYFIPESMKVSELLKEFQERKQKLAIVVDEHGGVSGLVTMEDLMEEIVGEIQDEYDKDEVHIIHHGPGEFVIKGDADLEELEDLLDLDLAADNYITVGGWITFSLGRLPEQGEKVEIQGLSIEILDVGQKQINKLRLLK